MSDFSSVNRRDFLSGRALQGEAERVGSALAEELGQSKGREAPTAGSTVRLTTRAMACEFAVILNPGPGEQVMAASDALDVVHVLEDQMSAYRGQSEVSQINKTAADGPVAVEPRLYELLDESRRICEATAGAFDPTSGPLIALWRAARQGGRVPNESEIAQTLAQTGIEGVQFDDSAKTVQFRHPGVELNLGGIGKGYALDRAGQVLDDRGYADWLIHGGHSSVLASGDHQGRSGWPVGIRNPLFPDTRLATILLRDQALSSSGSGVQSFRHNGRRYGHILDPRSGWPAEEMLSVTVLAPTASQADALSTAFFVLGVEKAREYCDNSADVSALLIPPPRRGRRLEPINCGLPDEVLFYSADKPQVDQGPH